MERDSYRSSFHEPIRPNWAMIAVVGSLVLAGIFLVLGSFYTVDEGTRGVRTRNGAFVSVEDPGFGLKVPFIDNVIEMEIRNMALEGDEPTYSFDTQQFVARVVINYEIDPLSVEQVFKREGLNYTTRRLWPIVSRNLKEVAGKYDAAKIIQQRDVFGAKVYEAIKSELNDYGIIVTGVQIKNVDFSDEFEAAIEAAMLAKAEVQREIQVLAKTRQTTQSKVVQAEADANAAREKAGGEADAKRAAAQADADAKRLDADAEKTRIELIGKAQADSIRLQGEAEAKAIQAKAEALAQNANLAPYTLALAAQNWDGKLPQNYIPGSALPILNVPGIASAQPHQ